VKLFLATRCLEYHFPSVSIAKWQYSRMGRLEICHLARYLHKKLSESVNVGSNAPLNGYLLAAGSGQVGGKFSFLKSYSGVILAKWKFLKPFQFNHIKVTYSFQISNKIHCCYNEGMKAKIKVTCVFTYRSAQQLSQRLPGRWKFSQHLPHRAGCRTSPQGPS